MLGSAKSSKRSSASPITKAKSLGSLKKLHWTPQMPIARAIQRDEEEIDAAR